MCTHERLPLCLCGQSPVIFDLNVWIALALLVFNFSGPEPNGRLILVTFNVRKTFDPSLHIFFAAAYGIGKPLRG
jgi:hypothetical protein